MTECISQCGGPLPALPAAVPLGKLWSSRPPCVFLSLALSLSLSPSFLRVSLLLLPFFESLMILSFGCMFLLEITDILKMIKSKIYLEGYFVIKPKIVILPWHAVLLRRHPCWAALSGEGSSQEPGSKAQEQHATLSQGVGSRSYAICLKTRPAQPRNGLSVCTSRCADELSCLALKLTADLKRILCAAGCFLEVFTFWTSLTYKVNILIQRSSKAPSSPKTVGCCVLLHRIVV